MLSPEAYESMVSQAAQSNVTKPLVENLIAELGTLWNLDDFGLDNDHCASFHYNHEFDITLFYFEGQQGVIAAAPMPVSAIDDTYLLRCLLSSNRKWPLTQGGYFGMLPDSDELYLFRFMSCAGVSVQQLDTSLASFAEFASGWRTELKQAKQKPKADKPVATQTDTANVVPISGMRV